MLKLMEKIGGYGLNSQWRTDLDALSKPEKVTFFFLIFAVVLLIAFDLSADLSVNQSLTHIALDSSFGLGAIFGLLITWKQMGQVRRRHVINLAKAENDASQWKHEAEAIQKGIADEIDHQMTEWSLTPTEKDVALFLLKGLSLREISTIRKTAERTVRHHTLAIYQKAGVTGRAELSAFFLEEFLDRQVR